MDPAARGGMAGAVHQVEMKQKKHLTAGKVGCFPFMRGKNTIIIVSGDPNERGALADEGGCDVKTRVVEEGRSLGKRATKKLMVHGAGAGIAGDDAADGDVGARGFDGELLKATLQPGGEVGPRRDQQVVGDITCRAPAAEAAWVEGGAVVKMRVSEEVAADHMGRERGGDDLGDKGAEPGGLEAGVVDTEGVLRGDVGGQSPTGGAEAARGLGLLQKAGFAARGSSGGPGVAAAGAVAMQGMHSTVALTTSGAPPRVHECTEEDNE